MIGRVAVAATDQEIGRCYPVMAELRPHLDPATFGARVREQEALAGYRIAYLEADHEVRAVAGFRISLCLAWGRFLYVDDLVTRQDDRSRGHGAALLDWLLEHARSSGCDELHLDSGVQRFGAHRFYLMKRMDITSHHFAIKLRV